MRRPIGSTVSGVSGSPQRTGTPAATAGTLGTFGGVFTPSVLTILGLVLFLRVAYVVGSVGLDPGADHPRPRHLGVGPHEHLAGDRRDEHEGPGWRRVLPDLAHTRGRVRRRRRRRPLSRHLGVDRLLRDRLRRGGRSRRWTGTARLLVRLIAAALVLLLAGIGAVGADLATRLQFLVMALLILALGSFFIGAAGDFELATVQDNLDQPASGVGFWEAFAIFFPAVTGFSQGVAMSGDLRSPSRSITQGTFAAVGLSTVVYVAAVLVLAGSAPAAVLVEETTTIMGDLSLASWTMLIGVLAATLSSALASTLGAPAGAPTARRGSRPPPPRDLLGRRRTDEQPPSGPRRLRRDRARHRGGRRPQRDRPGHLDVLPRDLRPHQLRDLLRDPGRQHLVPAALSLLRPAGEPRRHPGVRRRHHRDQSRCRRPRRARPLRAVQLSPEPRRPRPLGRQHRLAPLHADERTPPRPGRGAECRSRLATRDPCLRAPRSDEPTAHGDDRLVARGEGRVPHGRADHRRNRTPAAPPGPRGRGGSRRRVGPDRLGCLLAGPARGRRRRRRTGTRSVPRARSGRAPTSPSSVRATSAAARPTG